jgi:tetratricopeptide (TPR) repeat protein
VEKARFTPDQRFPRVTLESVANGEVHNEISASMAGPVVQAGTIHNVVVSSQPAREPHTIPRQLPPAVRDFAGREEHLATLDALLPAEDHQTANTAVISALDGTAGVGKTTLAVNWAHRVQRRFPGGTLFANLRGYGPSSPLEPTLVLAPFLRALGVAEERVPAELDAQVGMYRSLLAERHVLVVLDNASSPEQVRPLLPGAPGSLVLVTSRANLTGLIITEAASPLTVDLFTPAEADDLVRGIIGHERADAEPNAVADLITACARLPLALRIAASRIAARRHSTVADIVEEITEDHDQLDTLSGSGDNHSAVRPVFDWSYTRLRTEQAGTFRRLGIHPSSEFDVHAAAAVAEVDLSTARRHLEALADMHLIEPVGPRRYRLHDLLHGYAAHRAERDDTADDRRRARTTVLTWYAHTARTADRLVFPGLLYLDVELGPSDNAVVLEDRGQALAWLNREQANLMAALRTAVRHGVYSVALVLASTTRFLVLRERSLWTVRAEAETLGLTAARDSHHQAAEALLLGFRGETQTNLDKLDQAEADFTAQLTLARALDDPVQQRFGLNGLGLVSLQQQRYLDAQRYYQQALPLAREDTDRRPEAVVECNLSQISARLGHYDQALEHAERELALRRQTTDRVGEAYALHDVAVAHQGLGEDTAAIDHADRALALYRTLDGTEKYMPAPLETASVSLERSGNLPRAAEYLREAATILTDLDAPNAADLHHRWRALHSRTTASTDE